jgi:hypothetical protein
VIEGDGVVVGAAEMVGLTGLALGVPGVVGF